MFLISIVNIIFIIKLLRKEIALNANMPIHHNDHDIKEWWSVFRVSDLLETNSNMTFSWFYQHLRGHSSISWQNLKNIFWMTISQCLRKWTNLKPGYSIQVFLKGIFKINMIPSNYPIEQDITTVQNSNYTLGVKRSRVWTTSLPLSRQRLYHKTTKTVAENLTWTQSWVTE